MKVTIELVSDPAEGAHNRHDRHVQHDQPDHNASSPYRADRFRPQASPSLVYIDNPERPVTPRRIAPLGLEIAGLASGITLAGIGSYLFHINGGCAARGITIDDSQRQRDFCVRTYQTRPMATALLSTGLIVGGVSALLMILDRRRKVRARRKPGAFALRWGQAPHQRH